MDPRCDITFDNNPDGIYFAGQTISGVAVLDLDEVVKVRKVELKIEGYAECEWTESRQLKTRIEYTTYRVHEQYLDSVKLLDETETILDIQPGRHTYNFMVEIPETSPSSMNATYGYIVYRVVLNLNRPWKFDITFKQEFTVICPVNINSDPSWMLPNSQEEIECFCCFCCEFRPVTFTVKIPKTAFIPGEKILVHSRIENPTNVIFEHLRFGIIKHVIYKSQIPWKKKEEEVKVYERDMGEAVVNGSKDFEHFIEIPPTPASTVNPDFKVIRLNYELIVKAKFQTYGFYPSPKVKIPIIIGTTSLPEPIPIQPIMPQVPVPIIQPSAPVIGMPSAPMIPSSSNNIIDINSDDPPPTFEEAMNLPRVDQKAVRNFNTSRPLGFVVPGIGEKS